MNKIVFSSALSLLVAASLAAETATDGLAVEIDPVTYGFNGNSLHLKKQLRERPHWQLGLGTYAMDFPEQLVDVNDKNRNKGWRARLDSGIGLFADYFPSGETTGWFVGAQTAWQRYAVEKGGGQNSYETLLLMAHTGYLYNVSDRIYLKPWGGVGAVSRINGSNRVGESTYDVAPVTLFMTLHIGYRF